MAPLDPGPLRRPQVQRFVADAPRSWRAECARLSRPLSETHPSALVIHLLLLLL